MGRKQGCKLNAFVQPKGSVKCSNLGPEKVDISVFQTLSFSTRQKRWSIYGVVVSIHKIKLILFEIKIVRKEELDFLLSAEEAALINDGNNTVRERQNHIWTDKVFFPHCYYHLYCMIVIQILFKK